MQFTKIHMKNNNTLENQVCYLEIFMMIIMPLLNTYTSFEETKFYCSPYKVISSEK